MGKKRKGTSAPPKMKCAKTFLRLPNKPYLYVGMYLCVVLGLSIAISLQSSVYCDFGVVDGTFQNYNAWRRILGGQIVFKDFTPYLGIGHAIYGAIATGILGGTFHDSIFAGIFLTCIMSFVSIFVISKCIVRSNYVSSFVSLIIFYGYYYLAPIIDPLLKLLGWSLPLYTVGNSARIIRSFGLTQSIILFAIICAIIRRKTVKRELWCFIAAAIISGSTIAFSNDMGVAAYIVSCICALIYTLTPKPKMKYIFVRAGIWIAVSLGSFFVLITLITSFHPINYFNVTLGISSYQSWYNFEQQIYYLHDVWRHFTFADLLSITIAVINIVLYCKAKDKRIESLLIAYVLLANFIRQEMYDIITGGSVRETEYITLVTCVCSFIALLFVKRTTQATKTNVAFLSTLVAVCVLIPTLMSSSAAFAAVNTKGAAKYEQGRVKEMGGVLTNYSSELYALSEQIGDDTFWSTYATAFEVVKGKYQPSGVDYIIHVLGDKARQDYMAKFKTGNYAHVLNPSLMDSWEPWIIHSNWFFFREVLKDYNLVAKVGYLENWERSKSNNIMNNKVSIKTENQPDGSVLLKASSDSRVNAFADVEISYTVEKNKNFPIIIYNELQVVYKTFSEMYPSYRDRFGLPNKGQNISIPIYIHNGYGEVVLEPCPKNDTKVNFIAAKVSCLLKDPFNFNQAHNTTDVNWTNGVRNGGSQIVIQNTPQNYKKYIENKPAYLELDGVKYSVTEVADDHNGYFRVGLPSHDAAAKFAYPAKFDILYSRKKNDK
ncbi:hypothetical protein [Caproicibacter fermentans]|uniref:Uncharacterized protein n=1 Tax=Caproicibacter fermentans TaxID=2576756 RepID=A0A7G8TFN9_9FIRM|nr:hypothetical protein [Caproicibacter fermentans]QNK42430.1 hypothetical protein HCR03_09600 [Caproicibacter fermentans]